MDETTKLHMLELSEHVERAMARQGFEILEQNDNSLLCSCKTDPNNNYRITITPEAK